MSAFWGPVQPPARIGIFQRAQHGDVFVVHTFVASEALVADVRDQRLQLCNLDVAERFAKRVRVTAFGRWPRFLTGWIERLRQQVVVDGATSHVVGFVLDT